MQDLMPPINTQDSIFHDGDPTTGQLGTIVTASWLNNVQAATRDVQAEIKNVLAKAGMTPDPKKTNQLADAISQIVTSGNYASTAYVDNGLNKKIDKANISGVKGNDNDKVPSLNLFTTEVGKLATKGDLSAGLAEKQPAGNYADGVTFKKNVDNASMTSPAGKYSLIISNDGALFTWDGTNATFSVSPTGELLVGSVPYSHLTDVPMVQYLGNSDSHFVSQKAVTDAVNGKQAAGNYADGALIHKWTDNTATIVNTPNFGTRFAFYDSGQFVAIDPVTSEGRFGFSGSGELFKGSVPANLVTGLFSQYRNVTSARALGVEYKNASNKPKFVIISHHNNDGSLTIDVNGEQIYSSANTSNGSTRMNSYFIVPPNGTYKVNHMPFYLWSECE